MLIITYKERIKAMKKVLTIDGMHCNHCKMSVEKALAGVSSVADVKVNLEKKEAVVSGDALDEAALTKAVTDAGFAVTAVKDKKGIFG